MTDDRRREKEDFLQRLRTALGTQKVTKAANALGVGQPDLTRYLQGSVMPCYDFFQKAANAGLDINWLLTGKIYRHFSTAEDKLEKRKKEIEQHLSLLIHQLTDPLEIEEVFSLLHCAIEFKLVHAKKVRS